MDLRKVIGVFPPLLALFGMLLFIQPVHANGPQIIPVFCSGDSEMEVEVELDEGTVEVGIKCSGNFAGVLYTVADDPFAFGFNLVGEDQDNFCGQLFLMTAVKYESKCVGEGGEAEIEVKFKPEDD